MIAVDQLERLGGTDAGGYYQLAPCIVLAWPREGYVQSAEGARASLHEQHRIARVLGQRVVTVVVVDRVKDQDPRARRIWTDEVDSDLVCGLALVGSTMLGRAIASFFIGLARPRVPTVMVATVEQAVAWGGRTLANHGGPIGS